MPFPPPGDLPSPEIEHRSPALQADSLSSEPPGKPQWPPTEPGRNQGLRGSLRAPLNASSILPLRGLGGGRGPPRCGPPTPPQLVSSLPVELKDTPPAWGPPGRCRPHPHQPARKAGSLTSPHQPHALLSARALATMARSHFQSLFPLRSSLWDAPAPHFSVGHSLPLAPPPQNVLPPNLAAE